MVKCKVLDNGCASISSFSFLFALRRMPQNLQTNRLTQPAPNQEIDNNRTHHTTHITTINQLLGGLLIQYSVAITIHSSQSHAVDQRFASIDPERWWYFAAFHVGTESTHSCWCHESHIPSSQSCNQDTSQHKAENTIITKAETIIIITKAETIIII